ncbi:MAG: CoB--CoM heterodisulfide reductase iron-sulfur subunit B family protein [Polyangiaceae bacterium]|nr:CoB--CoM heterodisulfide reductase iron-sulfur subunit B family protein [Polyangiaceae bacterium]
MAYGLFLGCNMPALRPDVERAIRLTMPALGIPLEEMEGYVCCPAFGTFPSLDEEAHMAVSAWNLSIGEQKGLDILVECGSCYSSLCSGKRLLDKDEHHRARANALLAKTGRSYQGKVSPRHISDVLLHQVGVDKIRQSIKKPFDGLHAVVQYPCHTLFPSKTVGFEQNSVRPHGLADLVEALGARVEHFSLEYQCCGGAGGFHGSSKAEANAYAQRKLDAIITETRADFIVVSCITCLMHLDNVQKELSNGEKIYAIPVFDYNQVLALAMDFPASEVASIATVNRSPVIQRLG